MDAIREFLAMGGYAVYVWSAYGLAAVVLGTLAIVSLRELAAHRREVAALEAATPRRKRARGRQRK